jgi:predicted GNAT superfamily acetyltransferase
LSFRACRPAGKARNLFLVFEKRMPNVIQIRPLHSLAEFDECVRIQKLTWGRDILVPSAIFVVGEHTGGLTHGAFDGNQMIGFAMALAGFRDGHPFLHSHMTAVLPEYQNHGTGRRLKVAQLQDALRHGVRLIEWTFDPLELKNAHFNLNLLGAVVRVYIANCYGITESPLHGGLPTDRLVAEWWLDSARVRSHLDGNSPANLPPFPASARISIPANIVELKASDRSRAKAIQSSLRSQFENYFAQGLVAISIEKSASPSVDYLLAPAPAIPGLSFPALPH